MMHEKIDKVKKHFQDNKKVYIAAAVGIAVGAVSVLVLKQSSGNKATIDSWKMINWKSPHTSQTLQVIIPPRGNAGNAIQCDQTGTIFPSQNLAAKELGLNPGNLSQHLHGNGDSIKGFSFTKLTDNGVPITVA